MTMLQKSNRRGDVNTASTSYPYIGHQQTRQLQDSWKGHTAPILVKESEVQGLTVIRGTAAMKLVNLKLWYDYQYYV